MARAGRKDRGLFEKVKGSGIWWVRYHDYLGKERRKKVGTKTQAKAYYREMKTKVGEAKLYPERADAIMGTNKKSITLTDLFSLYENDLKQCRTFGTDMKRFMRSWLRLKGSTPLSRITKQDALKRQAARLEYGTKPATINREIAFIKGLLQRAVNDGILASNPFDGVKRLREDNRHHRFMLDNEEYQLQQVMDPEDFEVLAIAADTGLRRAEQFGLTWFDVSFEDAGWLTIRKTKTNKSRRVPLTKRAFDILKRRHQEKTCPWVFPNSNGNPQDADNFYAKRFKPALKKAGITDLTWHQAGRHTCGSRMALGGVSLQKIAQILGHSSTTTSERYAHLLPEAARSSIDVLNERKPGLRLAR